MNPWSHVSADDAEVARRAADDGPLRYERGGRVYASDGAVGTLRQVVVDEALGEVTMLVVQPDTGAEPVVAPADLVERGAGSAIFLRLTREQFALGAGRSPRYERQQFAAANVKRLAKAAASAAQVDRLRGISRVSRDALETGSVEPADRGDRGSARRAARIQERVALAPTASASGAD